MEVDFKCQYKTDYVAGGADVVTLPDIVDDSLTANGKWVYSLETVNPTKEPILRLYLASKGSDFEGTLQMS